MNAENTIKPRVSMNDELFMWFLKHEDDTPDKLAHSKTWAIMKSYLINMGYWKNKARGNPSAGYKAQQIRRNHER